MKSSTIFRVAVEVTALTLELWKATGNLAAFRHTALPMAGICAQTGNRGHVFAEKVI